MLLDQGRETIGTGALDGAPEVILKMPGDSYSPFFLSVAITVLSTAALLHHWWIAGAALLATLAASMAWLWPRTALGQTAQVPHG